MNVAHIEPQLPCVPQARAAMDETLRTFIAVSVPCSDELREVIGSLGEMGPAVKPAAADNLHITLKFLGETPAEQVPHIGEVLREAASVAPFEMELVGLGAFPRIERPSVIWAGVEGGEPLVRIAERLEKPLKKLGYPKERRAFSPHLTIARVRRKPPPELFELFDECGTRRFGLVPVQEVAFYRSELRPEGSKYTVLDAVELRA